MIDEKTTQTSKPTKADRDLLSSLRKRAPIESLRQVPSYPKNLTARTSPSTFLFLLSSQCQRADLTAQQASNVGESQAPDIHSENNDFLAGYPADQSASVRNRQQWE